MLLHRLPQTPHPLAITGLRRQVLQAEFVTEHGDEFAIGGLVLLRGHTATKRLVQRVDAAAAPGNLNGMADGPLYLAG